MTLRAGLSKGAAVAALILALVFLGLGLAEARNPDVSYWTSNLSSSPAPDEDTREDLDPEIAVVGNTVHVLWIRNNPSDYTLFYRRSTDGGRTWDPKQVLLVATDWSTFDRGYRYTQKNMVAEGNYVHIAYLYQDNLYYLRSTDNGATFEAARSLYAAGGLHDLKRNYIATSDGKLTICFVDNLWYSSPSDSPRSWGINLNSDDHGATFTRGADFFDSDNNGNGWSIEDLLRVGDRIYVLYYHSSFYYGMVYGRLYVAASSNAGDSFTSTLISVPSQDGEDKAGPLQDYHYVPKMAGVDNNFSVTWAGLDENDVGTVFYRRSTDSGTTFSAPINFSSAMPDGQVIQFGQETVAAQGNYVYCLFLTTGSKVYCRRSNDGGANFYGLQELSYTSSHFADGISLSGGWWPVLALDPADASGATVHSFWHGGAHVVSTDGGANFSAPQQVLPRFAMQANSRPQMAVGPDGRPHFVTEADFYFPRNIGGWGDLDIFYRALSPAAAPWGANNALQLVSTYNDYRYDNMQVLPSSYLNFTAQMTGEVWVRPFPGGMTTGSTWGVEPIFHKTETNYSSYALQTWGTYGGGQRRAAAEINTTSGNFWLNTQVPVPDKVWSHLAFTYEAAGGENNFKLYLNGQLIGQMNAAGNLATGDGLFFTGLYGIWEVAELRLWNVARSGTEIFAYMNRTLAGNEPGLNAYYTFNNTTKDLTGHGNDGLLMFKEQFTTRYHGAPGAIMLLLDN
jgi:hypothetical protein